MKVTNGTGVTMTSDPQGTFVQTRKFPLPLCSAHLMLVLSLEWRLLSKHIRTLSRHDAKPGSTVMMSRILHPLGPSNVQRRFTEGGLKFILGHLCVGCRAVAFYESRSLPGTVLWAVGRVFTHLDAHMGVVGIGSSP